MAQATGQLVKLCSKLLHNLKLPQLAAELGEHYAASEKIPSNSETSCFIISDAR